MLRPPEVLDVRLEEQAQRHRRYQAPAVELVKFGRVHWYPFKKTDDKFAGYQNCGVKAHREAQAEYGRHYLRRQEDAVAEDTVYSCRCKYFPGTNPDTGMAKPALWRVNEL
ncbi:unnamed protein product, partial [Symbiodinium sp. CCMP2456]